MTAEKNQSARVQRVRWLSLVVGGVLTLIGLRFFFVPPSASFTFGVAHPPQGYELHHIIAGRDIWLGLIVMAFAWLRDWRALFIWLVGAVFVCLIDAGIVWQSTGNSWAIAFHIASGVLAALLARGAWLLHRADASE